MLIKALLMLSFLYYRFLRQMRGSPGYGGRPDISSGQKRKDRRIKL